MGDTHSYQELTRWDKITVFFYRTGIGLTALLATTVCLLIYTDKWSTLALSHNWLTFIFILLYVFTGLTVFFIHLYIGSLQRFLKRLYIVAVLCFILFLVVGNSNAFWLFLPLCACICFVTAKEAFCFKIYEGYLLGLIAPLYIIMISFNALSQRASTVGFTIIAAMYLIFAVRKIFMPLHYDIGDKSAYID